MDVITYPCPHLEAGLHGCYYLSMPSSGGWFRWMLLLIHALIWRLVYMDVITYPCPHLETGLDGCYYLSMPSSGGWFSRSLSPKEAPEGTSRHPVLWLALAGS